MLSKKSPNRIIKNNSIYLQFFFAQFKSMQMLMNKSIIPLIGKYTNWSISISIVTIAKSGYINMTISSNMRNNMILQKIPFMNIAKGFPLALPNAVNSTKKSIDIELVISTIKFVYSSIKCDIFLV